MAAPKLPTFDRRWLARLAVGALLFGLLAVCGCTLQEFPQSTVHPQSDFAQSIQRLLETLVFWVVVIFVLVEGALIVTVVRFRARPGMPDPKPVHGNTFLEVAWTLAPALILTFVAVPTVLTIFKTQAKAPAGALEVKVVGHQWWWEFQYPELNISTGSELHVPVGRPVSLTLESADVIHSFWLPAVGGKRDVIPTRTNHMWFTPDSVGEFKGQCAELCGVSHANMHMKLFVQTLADFQAWTAAQQAPPVEPDTTTLAGHGKQVFLEVGCVACHTIQGISPGVIGPNLTHVGSRTSIAGSMFPNDPEHLARWIGNPQKQKPGATMLNLGLNPDQIAAVVAYLQSLK
jgi:cytochrome c oxidase subunit 2